jgi:hypothetical protein
MGNGCPSAIFDDELLAEPAARFNRLVTVIA